MAKLGFDSSAFDDIEQDSMTLTICCPYCQDSFDISLNETNSSVVCPHCNSTVQIESE